MATRTRSELLATADSILKKDNLTREDSSRVEQLIALADETEKDELRRATMAAHSRELEAPETNLPDQDQLRRATMAARDRELGRPEKKLETPEVNLSEDEAFRHYLLSG